jgi:hypothetical protein
MQKSSINITCQKLWADVQSNQLVTYDTTPHVHRKIMSEVTFHCSVWIVKSLYIGVSGTVDSIASKVCLISEQNVVMQAGVCIKPTAEFQTPTHVHRFKMLNLLDTIWTQSFIV